MPVKGLAPRASSTVSWGRAAPALHNANLGDRSPACPHSARPKFPGPARRPAGRHPLVTVAFSTVTVFFGGPSAPPPVTPALAIFSTAFSEAASIFPNGV